MGEIPLRVPNVRQGTHFLGFLELRRRAGSVLPGDEGTSTEKGKTSSSSQPSGGGSAPGALALPSRHWPS